MLKLNKNGYFQLDLMFAILIFFLLFLKLYFLGDSFYLKEKNLFDSQELYSQANDLCFLLVNSPGLPNNWEDNISNLVFLGLKSTNFSNLSTEKLDALSTSNYVDILDNTNMSDFFNLAVVGVDSGLVYKNLSFVNSNLVLSQKSVCYSNYNSELVKVFVEVWK